MNRFNLTMILALLAMIVSGICYAQYNTAYVCSTVSVNSSTVPVGALPVNRMTTFTINERSANASATPAAANVLVFPYVGVTVPTGVPSACASPSTTLTSTGCMEVTPTKPLSDAVSCDNPSCAGNGTIGSGWAAVLESGSTAVTLDDCYR